MMSIPSENICSLLLELLGDVLNSHELHYVENVMNGPMPRGRGMLHYKTPPQTLHAPFVDGKKHVVFTAYYPHINLVKKSHALRKTGRYHTTFIGCCVREDHELEHYFDEVYEAEDYLELFDLLAGCGSYAVHAISIPAVFGLMAVAARSVNGVKTIIDVNDAMLFIEKDDQALSVRLEKAMLGSCDLFTHKMPEQAIGDMRKCLGHLPGDVACHALPETDFFASPGTKRDVDSVVFAGGLIPYDIAVKKGHEGHLFDSLIHGICGNKGNGSKPSVDFSMFVNQNARQSFWEEHNHYLSMENTYPHFRFNKGVPFFRLPECISHFHYGLYYENNQASSYNPLHFKYNMPTKLFSYIEAGLPLVVPRHAEYIRQFTREHGLSVMYESDKPHEIPELINHADYSRLRDNVMAFRKNRNMESSLETLERVYQ